jgi:hypothetical protein
MAKKNYITSGKPGIAQNTYNFNFASRGTSFPINPNRYRNGKVKIVNAANAPMGIGELGRTPEELTTIHENVADHRQIQETVDAIVAKYNELMGGI